MADSTSPTNLSFDEALARLQSIVDTLEQDRPPLEEAVDTYAEGMALAEACLQRLDHAEQRIQELSLED